MAFETAIREDRTNMDVEVNRIILFCHRTGLTARREKNARGEQQTAGKRLKSESDRMHPLKLRI
jgi:hypothetical protein